MANPPATTLGNNSEEYYQITDEVFSSFSKYRPPIDLYQFNDDVGVFPYSKQGQRLSNAQVAEVATLSSEGHLFIARSDLAILSDHIVDQLDLVLLDTGLKPAEVASIVTKALVLRYQQFFNQPVKAVYDKLNEDFMVFTQYIFDDKHRLPSFLRCLYYGDYNPAYHAVNSLILGTWIFTHAQDKYARRTLDRACLGIYLHDIGFCKIPGYIVNKSGNLKGEEIEKIRQHSIGGIALLRKLGILEQEVTQAVSEHHERLDGTGYPSKTKTLSFVGKITAISDSLSSMIQSTTYSPSKDIVSSIQELGDMQEKYDFKLVASLINAVTLGIFDDKD